MGPGQATAYKVGMDFILEQRGKARTALGDAFDIREFHDAVLENGSVPLSILAEQIDAYIARNDVQSRSPSNSQRVTTSKQRSPACIAPT